MGVRVCDTIGDMRIAHCQRAQEQQKRQNHPKKRGREHVRQCFANVRMHVCVSTARRGYRSGRASVYVERGGIMGKTCDHRGQRRRSRKQAGNHTRGEGLHDVKGSISHEGEAVKHSIRALVAHASRRHHVTLHVRLSSSVRVCLVCRTEPHTQERCGGG